MNVIEITDPNYIVNKPFTVKTESSTIEFVEDDFINISVYKNKLLINNTILCEDVDPMEDYVETIEGCAAITEASEINEGSLVYGSIILG